MTSRLRRALASIGTTLGLGAVLTSALVGGAILHLDLPPARRNVERVVRAVLDGVFEGTVTVQGVERLGLDGAQLALVVVHDPSGIEVLRARGVRAEASVPTILRSALGSGDLDVAIPFVRIEQVDVRVEPNTQGQISIAAAFQPRVKAGPEPAGRPLRLSLDHVEIGAGYVFGRPDGTRPLDADLRHLTGSVKVEPGLVAVDVSPTGLVERRLLPGAIDGTAEYHLRVTGPKTPDDTETPDASRMWATFGGRVGNVPIVARGLLAGDHVELTADVARARPEHVKALVPGYPIEDTVSAHAALKGDLPRLTFEVAAQTEHHGAASAEGWVELGPPVRGEVTFRTEALDPRAAGPTLPQVRVTSKGTVRGELGPVVSVRADVQTEATSLDGQPIPAAEATAVFDGFVWSGTVKAHEPGASVQGSFATQKDGAVRFDVSARSPSLKKVPRLGGKLAGAADVRAAGLVRAGAIDATVTGGVVGLRAPGDVRVGRGTVKGRVHGPFDRLTVDATVTAADAVLGGYAVQDATVRLQGPAARPFVRASFLDQNDARIDASATVDPAAGAASRVRVRMERDGAFAAGSIARVRAAGGRVHIDGVALASPELGEVNGSLAVVRGEIVGALRAEGLDLTALRKLVGLPHTIGGKVDADVSLSPVKGGRRGHVRVSLRDGSLALVTGVAADVTATFDGDRVTTGGAMTITGAEGRCERTIASLRFSGSDGHIDGPLLSGETWSGATGRLDVETGDWDLECLAALVPVGLPISEIHGQLAAKFAIERKEGAPLPSIRDLAARTHYLTVVGPDPGGDEPPWASRDMDVTVAGDVDGATGETRLSVQLFDEALFARAALATTLDVAALLDPRRREAALAGTEVAATVSIPRRPLERYRTLPTFVSERLPSLTGEAGIDVYVVGSLRRPRAVVRVMGSDVAPGPDARGVSSPWAAPVGVDAYTFYDGARATLDAHVTRGGAEVLAAEASVAAPIDRLLSGAAPATYLAGRGSARFEALPLGDVPAFGDRAIGGHLSGKIAVEGLGDRPALTVDLRADDLVIGPDLAFREARVSLRTERAKGAPFATALADVHLLDRSGGALDASGYLQIDWRGAGMPSVRKDRPADLHARFSRFRLAAVEPLLLGAVRKVDGFVDGAVRVGWTRVDDADRGAVQADLRVSDGAFYLPQIGQQFRLVGDRPGPVRVVAEQGRARVENLVAEGDAGRVRVTAEAQLDGLALRSASGEVAIAEAEALPVTIEGVELGRLWGTFDLAAKATSSALALDVRSTGPHFRIPSATSRDVQDLIPHPDITISHEPLPDEEPAGRRGRPIVVTVRLESAIIEGPGIYVSLSSAPGSPPTFVVADRVRASGDIRVNSGSVEQVGRKFVVDQGVLHFREEEVGNPYVNVTAHWDPPDGSRVFVDYVGVVKPITREKLRLRSNPPRTQQEITSLLLFGSETGGDITASGAAAPAGASAAPEPTLGETVGEKAVDLGGELAAQQFNALLSGFAPLKGLSTRLGASEGGGIKAGLVYRVGDTVTAGATYEGVAPGTASTDTTAAATGSLTLDWRFYRNWLLRAKVGARDNDAAADRFSGTIEVLWQYRY